MFGALSPSVAKIQATDVTAADVSRVFEQTVNMKGDNLMEQCTPALS